MVTVPLGARGIRLAASAEKDARCRCIEPAARSVLDGLALGASKHETRRPKVIIFPPLAFKLDIINKSSATPLDQGGKGQGGLANKENPWLKFREGEAGGLKHVIPSGSLGLPNGHKHVMYFNAYGRLYAEGGPYRRHRAVQAIVGQRAL